MKRIIIVAACLVAIIITTDACWWDETPVDCEAIIAAVERETATMAETCESSMQDNINACASATELWQADHQTWADRCGYRLIGGQVR